MQRKTHFALTEPWMIRSILSLAFLCHVVPVVMLFFFNRQMVGTWPFFLGCQKLQNIRLILSNSDNVVYLSCGSECVCACVCYCKQCVGVVVSHQHFHRHCGNSCHTKCCCCYFFDDYFALSLVIFEMRKCANAKSNCLSLNFGKQCQHILWP